MSWLNIMDYKDTMDYDKAINIIKYSLGYPSVNLEIDDDVIESFFMLALTKAVDYSNFTSAVSKPFQEVIYLPEALSVVRVCDTDSIVTELDDRALFSYFYSSREFNTNGYKDLLITQARSSFLYSNVNKGFRFFKDKLYLFNYNGNVTIEYIPKSMHFHDLESNLQSWVIKYTKCLCKEALGRIRSKYKSSSGPFELDGDTLLNEYSEERTQLEDELSTSQNGFFFVDTDN